MKNRLREELEAMLGLHTGDSFTADNVHTLVNGIFAADEGGGFKFVEYDNIAFPDPHIGDTADSIKGLGYADESMLKTVFIMPNNSPNPTATMMIVVDEKEPSTDPKTYQYVYVGNINDLPSDVLTESSIINDLTTGGTDKPLSAEQGRTLNSHVNYTTCGSGAADEVKLISDDGFELSTHLRLLVKMNNTNTHSTPKFNINNTGIKDVWYKGSVASDTNTWSADEVLDVYYDGTKYIANTHGGAQFSTGEKVGDVGIDDEPTVDSNNLVKSGGVYNSIDNINLNQTSLISKTQGIIINLSEYPNTLGAFSSTNWNCDQYNRYHKAIQLSRNERSVSFTANANRATRYFFAKSYITPTNGAPIDVVMEMTAYASVPINESAIVDIPFDATYLLIEVSSNSPDETPKSVMFFKTSNNDLISKNEGIYKMINPFVLTGYINTSGNVVSNASSYSHTRYYKISPSETIYAKIPNLSTSALAIAVYTSLNPKTFSSELSLAGKGSSDENYEFTNTTDFDVYIILSSGNSNVNNTEVIVDNTKVKSEIKDLNIKIDELNTSFWDYGNIGTNGQIIIPITNNRVHSAIFLIDDIKTISCSDTQKMGYALYDSNKTFIARVEGSWASSLDLQYISEKYVGTRYISVLLQNIDNSNIDIANNPPALTYEKVLLNKNIAVNQTVKLFPKTQLPVIIFNFDDCLLPGDYKVAKLFESKGVRCGFAFIATEENIQQKTDMYIDLQRRGFDILNHSSDVNSIITSNYTFEQARENISTAYSRLTSAGFVVNGFVCPNSEMSESFLPIVDAMHAYNFIGAIGGVYGSNTRESDLSKLLRYSLESNTKTDIKSYIDDCIQNDKCLAFYAHTSRLGQTIGGELFDLDKVEEILDYCISKRNNLECYIGGSDDAIKYYYGL